MDDDIRAQLVNREYRPAFEALVERYQNKVFRLALSMVRNETQAQDMAQEIFLKIWKGLPGYHGEASLSTWIYTVSRNACLTELKRRAARPTVSYDAPEWSGAVEHAVADAGATAEAGAGMDVQALLSRLPERYRQVLVLFYLERKSYEEVAAMLGVPMGTVKTLLHRARKQLLKSSGRSEHVYA